MGLLRVPLKIGGIVWWATNRTKRYDYILLNLRALRGSSFSFLCEPLRFAFNLSPIPQNLKSERIVERTFTLPLLYVLQYTQDKIFSLDVLRVLAAHLFLCISAIQEVINMPKRYTAQQKEDVLRCLQANDGSVMLTSIQTGVSERSIRYWKQRQFMEDTVSTSQTKSQQQKENAMQQQQKEDKSMYGHDTSSPNDEKSDPQLTELRSLRQTIMNHIFELAADLSSGDELVSQRAIAVSRLLDRIPKLDSQIKLFETRRKGYQIEYIYGGKSHNIPPWENDEFKNTYNDALFPGHQPTTDETPDTENND